MSKTFVHLHDTNTGFLITNTPLLDRPGSHILGKVKHVYSNNQTRVNLTRFAVIYAHKQQLRTNQVGILPLHHIYEMIFQWYEQVIRIPELFDEQRKGVNLLPLPLFLGGWVNTLQIKTALLC